MKKKIAVLMSIYHGDIVEYVSLSINSILNQTYSNFDLYIQYDGWVNPKIDEYIKGLNDSRIKVYKTVNNLGLAQALNNLLDTIKSMGYDYIARMDADDISKLDRFDKQIQFLERYQDVDVVGGAINEINEYGVSVGKVVKYPCSPDECFAFFAKRNPVAHPTTMFRRRFFDKVDWRYPVDYIRNEDTRLWHEGYKNGCVIANIPDIILYFRVTNAMFSQRRNGKDFAKKQLELRKKIRNDLGYGISSLLYAYAMFLLMISPSCIIKIAYSIFR